MTVSRLRIALLMAAAALALAPDPASAGGQRPRSSSPEGLWTEVVRPPGIKGSLAPSSPSPRAYRRFRVQPELLRELLERAPLESGVALPRKGAVGARGIRPGAGGGMVMTLPMPDGTFPRFRVLESPILSPELAAQHPELKTYVAQGIDDPTATARLDHTPDGFHAMVLSAAGTFFVDPHPRGDTEHYISFDKRDVPGGGDFRCLTEPEESLADLVGIHVAPSGANLRTYRAAITATGEYTQFFGGVTGAQNQITTTMNRVTGIYEREVAIRLNVAAFNVYADPATDPFPSPISVNGALLTANDNDLDTNVGAANYDIGHLFNAGGGGGLAQLSCVCGGSKGRAATALPNPGTDVFSVDYVAHEMGHQFGGNHSFNGTTGSCGGGNRNGSTAFEPGSGTTIMAYAGICGAEDVQSNSDPFFHTISFDEITNFRDAGGACGVQTVSGNTAPSVNAGPDYTIPRDTPFTLTATGSDPNGDALTFSWEQFDLGAASPPPNNADGPLFRSRPPTTSPSRTFPRLPDILSGAATPWERLPTVDRTENFRVTARDNRLGGGGVNYDGMVVTVSGAPFRVTAPNGGESLHCGCAANVTWDVGGGSVAANVNILYSSDGGNSFPIVLAAGTPNDGSESVTLPCSPSGQGRVRVEPVGNIFFDLSNANFALQSFGPTAALSASGGAVDALCRRLVTFGATVTDDCKVNAGDVGATVSLLTGNATLGAPAVGVVQTDAVTVTVTGNVLVSGLTSSPATVRVRVDGADACANPAFQIQQADVFDASAPTILCPAPALVQCTAPGGTPAGDPQLAPFFAGVSASDNCDATPAIGNNAPPFFPLGTTPVTFTATDASSNSNACGSPVTVQDTLPPQIQVVVSPTVLWPPNHRMVDIEAMVTATDVCDGAPTFVLTSITSNEPDDGQGDGNTTPDIQGAAFGTPDTHFQLRAERSGPGSGRVYTIVYTAMDGSGNTAQATALVRVPHSSPH